jgi:hypothetical protein
VALLAAAAAVVVLGRGPALPLVAVGSIVAVAGVVLLTRFLGASRDFAERA